MNIFVLLIIAMAIIIFFMRKKVAVGKCLIIGGLFMWAVRSLNPELLLISGKEMLLLPRTYDLMFSLYFVMCLEIELRTSGVLSDMVSALQRIFSSGKAILAVMPGNLDLAAVAMVFGTAGQMITPTHVCFTVTTDYFNADFFTVLKKMVLIEIIVLTIFSVITYIIW